MDEPQKFTGDDWDFQVDLTVNNVADDISAATDIKVAVVGYPYQTRANEKPQAPSDLIVPAITVTGLEVGSDLSAGRIIPIFDGANTDVDADKYRWGYLEIQVTIGGRKKTYERPYFCILKGHIA